MTPGPLRTAAVGILLAAIAALWSAPAAARPRPCRQRQQPPRRPEAPPKAKRLYERIGCYQCHSEQGQGGTQGPRLGPRPIPFQAFLRYLRTPKGEMPPYKAKVMSDQDVADVYAFLQALPPPPPLSSLPLLQP